MDNIKTLVERINTLNPEEEGEEYEGKLDGLMAELEAAKNHKHIWKEWINTGKLFFVRCDCGLQVEIYSDHVALWDYNAKVGHRLAGWIDF